METIITISLGVFVGCLIWYLIKLLFAFGSEPGDSVKDLLDFPYSTLKNTGLEGYIKHQGFGPFDREFLTEIYTKLMELSKELGYEYSESKVGWVKVKKGKGNGTDK